MVRMGLGPAFAPRSGGSLSKLACGLLLAGCAVAPPPLAGIPLAPRQVTANMSFAMSVGPARGQVVDQNGVPHNVSGNGDQTAGRFLSPEVVAPVVAHVRAGVAPRIDLGLHVAGHQFNRSGLEVGGGPRLRLTPAGSGSDLHLVVDGETAVDSPAEVRRSYAVRSLLEWGTSPGEDVRVAGALGASVGVRRHGISGEDFADPNDLSLHGGFGGPAAFVIRRSEVRLEGAVGTVVHRGRVALGLWVMPYVVVHSGAATGVCSQCLDGVRLVDFDQRWGLTFMLTPTLLLGPRGFARRE